MLALAFIRSLFSLSFLFLFHRSCMSVIFLLKQQADGSQRHSLQNKLETPLYAQTRCKLHFVSFTFAVIALFGLRVSFSALQILCILIVASSSSSFNIAPSFLHFSSRALLVGLFQPRHHHYLIAVVLLVVFRSLLAFFLNHGWMPMRISIRMGHIPRSK